MINKLSESVADYFLKNNIIEEKDTDIYIYGSKLIISSLLGVLIIWLSGTILEKFTDSIIFLICFMLLRQYSGGYHADSYFKCNLYFIITFLIVEVTVIFTQENFKGFLSAAMFCTSFVILLKFAPLDNKYKRLSESQKRKNKRISIKIFTVLLVIVLLLKITVGNYYYNIAVTEFSVVLLMIIQVLKEEKNQWKD